MLTWDSFILIAVVFPLVAALLCFLVTSSRLRKGIVILTSIILILSAVWLHFRTGLEPISLSFPGLNQLIFVVDLLVLGYIAYVAFERRHPFLIALAVLQLGGLLYLELILRPDTTGVPSMVIDRLSVVMYLVVSVVGSIICIYALKYMDEHEQHVGQGRNGRFFLWLLAFLGIMNGVILANNLFWFYLFWELTTLCSFQLIGHEDTEEARQNALLALFLNSIGGLALVTGIGLLVKSFGGSAASLMTVVNSGLGTTSTSFLVVLALFSLGGFTKAAQFPFQSWLLGAMVAPTPVSALLHSSTMVKAGVYLVLRLAPAYSGVLLSSVIAFFGVFTFFSASLLAVGEDNAKRVLAYSTIANLGLIIACCGLNTPLAISAAVLLIIFHAVSKALLFMGTGVIEHHLGSRNIENMEGLAVRMPAMTLVMSIGVFSMFLPPFGMLFAKWAAIETSLREPLLLFLFVGGSTLTALFWTKWLGRMLSTLPGAEKTTRPVPMSGYYVFSLGTLALGAVLLSFAIGGLIQNLARPATILWYPPAIHALPGLNLAVFSWTNYFNPEIVLEQSIMLEGLFPVGILFAGLLIMLLIPLVFFRSEPREEEVGGVYLCGENVDPVHPGNFVTAMEGTSEAVLGGYYFRGLLSDKLRFWLNLVALAILGLMIGVVVI